MRPIDADALREKISSLSVLITGIRNGKGTLFEYMEHYRDSVFRIISEAPTLDVAPVVHGRWTIESDDFDCEFVRCSVCGEEFFDGDNDTVDMLPNYCPYCGAKMDGDNT